MKEDVDKLEYHEPYKVFLRVRDSLVDYIVTHLITDKDAKDDFIHSMNRRYKQRPHPILDIDIDDPRHHFNLYMTYCHIPSKIIQCVLKTQQIRLDYLQATSIHNKYLDELRLSNRFRKCREKDCGESFIIDTDLVFWGPVDLSAFRHPTRNFLVRDIVKYRFEHLLLYVSYETERQHCSPENRKTCCDCINKQYKAGVRKHNGDLYSKYIINKQDKLR